MKFKLPNTLVLIFSILIIVTILTWILPGGRYERIEKDGREYLEPDSYTRIESIGQDPMKLLMAPLKGFVSAANIIGFVLIVGGAFFVIQKTGAINSFIHSIARLHKKSIWMQRLTIPVFMMVFSFFGASFGMSEEIIPFILIFVPMAISIGYDSIVGTAIPFVGAGVGFAGAFLNPFTIGIAQGVAELPPFSGIGYRLICWVLVTLVAIIFVMRYAALIRLDARRSPVYHLDQYWRERLDDSVDNDEYQGIQKHHYLIILLFLLAIVILIAGVTQFNWYIIELSALFLGLALIAGFIGKLSANEIAETFIEGARELMIVAFIIALAKSILVLATDGQIIDAILRGLSSLVKGAHPVIAAQLMLIVQSTINVFIPSGSGQAALVMPIMAPLSDLLEVTRQTAVLAFQFGDGFTNLIIPTSGVTMGVLGIAKIPYEKWFSWMLPLQLILFITGLLLLIPPVLFQWGPF